MKNSPITALAAACLFGLAACGNDTPPAADPPVAPATTTAPDIASTDVPATAETPVDADTAMPAAVGAPDNGKPAAEVNDCSTTIEGNDAMQFNVGSITVPSSCSEFTITLEHTGQMPVAAMGHNVVISKAADREAVSQAGMSAGVDGDYVDPNDDRVIAHTELIGGGETTSVTFPVSEIQGDGPYEFFCSFPGHWAIMRGSIQVG